MTAKEYLAQAYWLDRRINGRLEMLMSLRDLATKTTAIMQGEAVSHTREVHSMENVIAKVVDMEKELNADIDRLIDLKKEIAAVIGQVSHMPARMVLEYRYLCFYPWDDIAGKMRMHVSNVYKLHARGLGEADAILKKDLKLGSIG